MILSLHKELVSMSANALIQTRIDAEIKARASAVLEKSGLTVSDAVRIMLTRTANEGALPMSLAGRDEEPAGYDAWFRAKVQEALDDPNPSMAHEEVQTYFAQKRQRLLAGYVAK
jgi:DNA-damage-inducible protein J